MLKWCYRCDRELPIINFNRDSGRKDGLNHRCRKCEQEMRTKRRKNQAYKIKQRNPYKHAYKGYTKPKRVNKTTRKWGVKKVYVPKRPKLRMDGFFSYEPKYEVTVRYFRYLRKKFRIIDETVYNKL